MSKILRNICRCKSCGETLESKSSHDFVQCKCENKTFVDGGQDYVRHGGKDLNLIEVLTEYGGDNDSNSDSDTVENPTDLTYNIDRVWKIINKIDRDFYGSSLRCVLPGSPTYLTVFKNLKTQNITNPKFHQLLEQLSHQIQFNSEYEHKNYEKLR